MQYSPHLFLCSHISHVRSEDLARRYCYAAKEYEPEAERLWLGHGAATVQLPWTPSKAIDLDDIRRRAAARREAIERMRAMASHRFSKKTEDAAEEDAAEEEDEDDAEEAGAAAAAEGDDAAVVARLWAFGMEKARRRVRLTAPGGFDEGGRDWFIGS